MPTHPKNAGCRWLMLRCFLFFCLSSLNFLFPKDTSPVTVLVWLISYPRQRGGGRHKKATAAGKSARALGASSARVSCCFFKPHFPLRRARREQGEDDSTGVCEGIQKSADKSDLGAQPVSPLWEAGKLQAAPTALPPARHSRLLGLCSSSWDPLGGDPTPR